MLFKTVNFTRRPLQGNSESTKSTNEFDAGGTLGHILLLTNALKYVYMLWL
jgi:hypothetical protein